MTMPPADRQAITTMTAQANGKRFVEYAFIPRLLLWVCWSVATTPEPVEGDGREIAAKRCAMLDALLRAMAIPMGVRGGDAALMACKAAIDSVFSRYSKGREHKKTAWVALAAYHMAGALLDEGLIPAYEPGSPMACTVDAVVGLLTPEQIEMFDRGARKAAREALHTLRTGPYKLWQKPWTEYPQTKATTAMLDAFRTVTPAQEAAA